MNKLVSLIVLFLALQSKPSFGESSYVENFCEEYYKDNQVAGATSYGAMEQNDNMAICFVNREFKGLKTLILREGKWVWSIDQTFRSQRDINWLKKTYIAYQYHKGEWFEYGLKTSETCIQLASAIENDNSAVSVNKFLFDSYSVIEEGNSNKYVDTIHHCLVEFKKPTLNRGISYFTLEIDYNIDNGVYEYQRNANFESGGSAIPFEDELKAIVKDRLNRKLF